MKNRQSGVSMSKINESTEVMRKIIWLAIIFSIIAGGIFSFNYFTITKPLSEVLESETRNSGISIKSHYGYYLQPTVLVIDVRDISGEKNAADVFRVFLQYASKLKEKSFNTVLLQSKGKTKYFLKGDYFKRLGDEYRTQNPMYTIRTFTEHVYAPDGSKAFGTWSGGLLGVLKKQMEDFSEFHKKWYVEDM